MSISFFMTIIEKWCQWREHIHIVIQIRHYSTHQNLWFPWLEKAQVENGDNGIFRLLPNRENDIETYICRNKNTNGEPFLRVKQETRKTYFVIQSTFLLVHLDKWNLRTTVVVDQKHFHCCHSAFEYALIWLNWILLSLTEQRICESINDS